MKCFNSPLLIGIRPGSTLPAKKPVTLTCSTEFSTSIKSIDWFVNGEAVYEDVKPVVEAGQIISNFLFVPKVSDKEIECKIYGDLEQSAIISFKVSTEFKIVQLQRAEESDMEQILWIPFDINRLEINRLESSGEETEVTFSKDIYKVMEDVPTDASNSYKLKRRSKMHHKKVDKFVTDIHPVSMKYLSSSSSSAPSLMLVLSLFFKTFLPSGFL